MTKLFSIQEVAKILGITTNKIRFYEKKGLIYPTRGKENAYRYFSEEDIIRLQTILLYRELGLGVSQIEILLKDATKANYLEHFYNQWQVVNNQIQELSQMRVALEHIMDKMYLVAEDEYTKEIVEEIQENVEKMKLKNSWKDKWNFNNWARSYDEDVKLDYGTLNIYAHYDELLEAVVKQAQEHISDNAQVLDIGVGTGNLANRFYNLGYEIIGVDQSRAMLDVAKSKNRGLKVRLGEFMKLPFENKCFDVIVSTYAFHHLTEAEKQLAIEEMMRVLKDDGVIVLGDLMFENEKGKREVYEMLSDEEKVMVEDEYYTDIEKLEGYVKVYHKEIRKIQIDRLCWITAIR